jgi:glucose-6-phosphate-specific signal transduction histidine kinase
MFSLLFRAWDFLMAAVPSQFHFIVIIALIASLFSKLGRLIKLIIVLAIVFFALTYGMQVGILSVPSWWPTAIHI